MKAASEFFSRIIPKVPGCTTLLAQQAVVDAAVYLCEHSLVLKYNTDAFNTVSGTSMYDIDVPASHDLSRVVYVTVDGDEIQSLPINNLPLVTTDNAKPTKYYVTQLESETQLNLYATPDDAYSVVVNVALRPSTDTTFLADDLYHYWMEPIIAGALGRIYAVPGQPFTDYTAADYYQRRAKLLCHNARNEGNIGRVIGSLQTQPRPFV